MKCKENKMYIDLSPKDNCTSVGHLVMGTCSNSHTYISYVLCFLTDCAWVLF